MSFGFGIFGLRDFARERIHATAQPLFALVRLDKPLDRGSLRVMVVPSFHRMRNAGQCWRGILRTNSA